MMKNLLIGAALWGFFFASAAIAQTQPKTVTATIQDVVQGSASTGKWFDWIPYRPFAIYADFDPALSNAENIYLQFDLMFKLRMWDADKRYPCTVSMSGVVTCTSDTGKIFTRQLQLANVQLIQSAPETQTCNFYAGDKFFNKNQKDICADTGGSTGGTASKPLYCMSEWLGGISSESQHRFTSVQCSALDPDPNPAPNPDPDPNPDPQPDPKPDPGTPGGSTQPKSGSTGNTTGTSGNNPVNLVMDYKPVTERLDLLRADARAHANYLGQQIAAAGAAGTAATNSLKPLLQAIATKTDGVANAVKEGNAEIKGELNNLNNTGKAIEGTIKDGNTALGEKLDGIKEGIDKLTEGEPIDGTAAANNVELPDYDTAVKNGVQQIQNTVERYAAESGINDLTNREAVTGMFSAAQSFGEVFDIARSNCSPIPFGSHASFNICAAAPNISMVLEIIVWALTAIFIFHFIGGLLIRERLT